MKITKKLINKLTNSNTTVAFETSHYRHKQHTPGFKAFKEAINIPIHETELQFFKDSQRPAYKSGAAFRLIQLALSTEAKTIYFAGFDGFNKDFSNIHAFTKHRGLKDTDTRRDYEGHPMSYLSIFTDAFNVAYKDLPKEFIKAYANDTQQFLKFVSKEM